MSISAKSAASTPPASDRIVTSASRSSYSPDSSVRTSSAEISSRSLARSASASAMAEPRRSALVLGELVEHGQVVEPAPQVLEAPQLALGVREPAGDLLRGLLVAPQVGLARLVFEVRDLGAQRGEVGHRLDALQGARELLDVGCGVGVHNAPGYAVSLHGGRDGVEQREHRPRGGRSVNSATARAHGSSAAPTASCAVLEPVGVGAATGGDELVAVVFRQRRPRTAGGGPAGCAARRLRPGPPATPGTSACPPR